MKNDGYVIPTPLFFGIARFCLRILRYDQTMNIMFIKNPANAREKLSSSISFEANIGPIEGFNMAEIIQKIGVSVAQRKSIFSGIIRLLEI